MTEPTRGYVYGEIDRRGQGHVMIPGSSAQLGVLIEATNIDTGAVDLFVIVDDAQPAGALAERADMARSGILEQIAHVVARLDPFEYWGGGPERAGDLERRTDLDGYVWDVVRDGEVLGTIRYDDVASDGSCVEVGGARWWRTIAEAQRRIADEFTT